MTEIDNEHFCSHLCDAVRLDMRYCKHCGYCHSKWPTFSQFEREYGRKVQRGDAIYVHNSSYEWYGNFYNEDGIHDWVVACTPYGRPPKGWRPGD